MAVLFLKPWIIKCLREEASKYEFSANLDTLILNFHFNIWMKTLFLIRFIIKLCKEDSLCTSYSTQTTNKAMTTNFRYPSLTMPVILSNLQKPTTTFRNALLFLKTKHFSYMDLLKYHGHFKNILTTSTIA